MEQLFFPGLSLGDGRRFRTRRFVRHAREPALPAHLQAGPVHAHDHLVKLRLAGDLFEGPLLGRIPEQIIPHLIVRGLPDALGDIIPVVEEQPAGAPGQGAQPFLAPDGPRPQAARIDGIQRDARPICHVRNPIDREVDPLVHAKRVGEEHQRLAAGQPLHSLENLLERVQCGVGSQCVPIVGHPGSGVSPIRRRGRIRGKRIDFRQTRAPDLPGQFVNGFQQELPIASELLQCGNPAAGLDQSY